MACRRRPSALFLIGWMDMNMTRTNGRLLKPPAGGATQAVAGVLLFFSLLAACSQRTQVNERPLLASSWGGAGGGPIDGKLEVMVFNDSLHLPIPGVVVSLGSSGAVSGMTNSQGIVNFEGVFGPQDVHLFFCSDCGAGGQFPLPYEAASFYQVNSAHLAAPLFPRDPAVSQGTLQGKVFDAQENEGVFLGAIDEIGKFSYFSSPLRSTTYQFLNEESPPAAPLTFIYSSDLDRWAAADPAAGKQAFSTVALLGTAIGPSGQPQGGVRLEARYFNGNPGGRAYYFNGQGEVDPALEVTSGAGPAAGRFVFLRLFPNNDFIIAATSLGTGVGTRFVRLPGNGTLVAALPVSPSTGPLIDLSGRVVQYRPDFREEERKGPFAAQNIGIPGALISFSGDTFAQASAADRGPGIDGNYRIDRHLLPNSRYVVVVLSGRGYRQTYQEIRTTSRSRLNYPIAAILLDDLVNLLREAKIPDIAQPLENGVPKQRFGLLPGHGEIVGRIVERTGAVDGNGDPIVRPVSGATLTVTDDAGNEVHQIDRNGNKVNNIIYPNLDGTLTDPTGSLFNSKTTEVGEFVVFDLPAPGGTAVYNVVAKDAAGAVLMRKSVPVYAEGVRLVEWEKETGVVRPSPAIVDSKGQPVGGVSLSLVGGALACPKGCVSDPDGTIPTPPGETPATLPGTGDYFMKMERFGGGGDYAIPFAGSKRRVGLSAFRYSGSAVNNVTFQGGLGPLNPGRDLLFDIGFKPAPSLPVTTGNLFLPPSFPADASRNVLVGAVGSQGLAFVGLDSALFFNPLTQYRTVSLPAAEALSYFLMGFAQSGAGESSLVIRRGFQAIPEVQDLTFGTPPKLLSPKGESGVTTTPRLSWSPPDEGPPDLYRLFIETPAGARLWQGWVPGNMTEATLSAVPAAFPEIPPVLSAGGRVKWTVHALRAGGLNFNQFTLKELGDQRVGDSSAASDFVP